MSIYFFRDILQQIALTTEEGLHPLRVKALAFLDHKTLPTTRSEAWRFTDLAPLSKIAWAMPTPASSLPIPLVDPQRYPFYLLIHHGQLVASHLPDGLEIQRSLEGSSLGIPTMDEFTALNTVSCRDPLVLSVKQPISDPITCLYIGGSPEQAVCIQPRLLIQVAAHAALTLVEEFTGTGCYWTNSVTEVSLQPGAQVQHIRWQQDSSRAFHIGHTAVYQQRDSHYTAHTVQMGSLISRHDLQIFSQGEGTETVLQGLTWIGGEQLSDTHSHLELSAPNATSRHVHKNIVRDHAHAVFNGRIHVQAAAQLTEARQSSRTLLLSPKARIDTQPQLEIQADNVKCAHGATVSELESDLIFYLQSRGIDQEVARMLLTQAFAAEMIQGIPVAEVRHDIVKVMMGNSSSPLEVSLIH